MTHLRHRPRISRLLSGFGRDGRSATVYRPASCRAQMTNSAVAETLSARLRNPAANYGAGDASGFPLSTTQVSSVLTPDTVQAS
jgi:hypothetical protein